MSGLTVSISVAIAGAVSYALWIVVAPACFHNTSLGLPSFGVGVVVSYPVYAFICDAMTRGDAA